MFQRTGIESGEAPERVHFAQPHEGSLRFCMPLSYSVYRSLRVGVAEFVQADIDAITEDEMIVSVVIKMVSEDDRLVDRFADVSQVHYLANRTLADYGIFHPGVVPLLQYAEELGGTNENYGD